MENTRIGVIGTGYVGLVSGACFANLGYEVRCLDIVEEKVKLINQGKPPIFENGLEDLLNKVVLNTKKLTATLNRREVLENSDIIFFCLATPSSEDGAINLNIMLNEARAIGNELKTISDYKVFVVKSTVVPGSTNGVIRKAIEEGSGKLAGKDFGLAMNPEFLMEGLAINNFADPDRIVIGSIDQRSFEDVKTLYSTFDCEILDTSCSAAEMIKYAGNSFLAMKISFINEIANMSEKLGINVDDVARGVGLDDRISSRFLRAGVGFGGSCFPKDVKALNYLSGQINEQSLLLPALLKVNKEQPKRVVTMLKDFIDLKNKTVALLGLAFKPETDDMREAPSIKISQELIDSGAIVKGYDPIAKHTAEEAIPNIIHCSSISEVLQNSDAAIIVTEWDEFKKLKSDDFIPLRDKVIIDGRRILNMKEFTQAGFKIRIIGQSASIN